MFFVTAPRGWRARVTVSGEGVLGRGFGGRFGAGVWFGGGLGGVITFMSKCTPM